ncbi:hypothetical protein UUU_00530 [Klebsiella pneumoniae subsp. pneumoniae DSM 30104 = JCM 1662 = NBRC 14940]|nr:hypothetical protein UUU_00530 [Klebsiella pneumoniae subsp. pneumoniae DSM 30104 = JCM 1662 = NBRC 14940]
MSETTVPVCRKPHASPEIHYVNGGRVLNQHMHVVGLTVTFFQFSTKITAYLTCILMKSDVV